MKNKSPKYKKGDKLRLVLDGEEYADDFVIDSVSHFDLDKKKWAYEIVGKADVSYENELKPLKK